MLKNSVTGKQDPELVQQEDGLEEHLQPVDMLVRDRKEMIMAEQMLSDVNDNTVGNAGAKRKQSDFRNANDGESETKTEHKSLLKKVKAERKSLLIRPENPANGPGLDGSQDLSNLSTVSKDDEPSCSSGKENAAVSIKDIVQGTGHKPSKKLARVNVADMSSDGKENIAGLRLKKIMRRAGDDKDSAIVVQKLRKEIREAIRSKSCKELGKDHFDPKLLDAFRAVVAGSIAETKRAPVDLKAKKSLLQKGKIRENLTKKIYGIGGKRRRAWTRDCEIEFWKYRCSKVTKPEKIQTLRSVLDLLREESGKAGIMNTDKGDATGSILSRLYLADTSVFPRKDDIKPVSHLKANGVAEQNKETVKASNSLHNEVPLQVVTSPLDAKGTKDSVSTMMTETSRKAHTNICSEGPIISKLGGLKRPSLTGTGSKSDDLKSDKRKWALEVLARKTTLVNKNAAQEKEEDIALLKQTYPLLAQLPKDMRPVLSTNRHNKIPISIRQAQLYRITENLLKKANLPFIRRTAETELAVADAVNIEKGIADRSNSKVVYLNLCSQETHRKLNATNSCQVTELEACPSLEADSCSAEVVDRNCHDAMVDEALRNTGLLSDSPPGSPQHPVQDTEVDVKLSKQIEDSGPDNVFEVDDYADVDIYGDFEYNLEDDDFVGSSALKISEQHVGESKMKVIFSTVTNDLSDATLPLSHHERQEISRVSNVPLTLLLHDMHNGISTTDSVMENYISQNSLHHEGDEDPEYEELYGPDKEPLAKKYPETALVTQYDLVAASNGDHVLNPAVDASEKSDSNMGKLKVPNSLHSPFVEDSPSCSQGGDNLPMKDRTSKTDTKTNSSPSVSKKVEAYIKEHIRPLCKSGVITVEQYRWAVGKTTEKVMKYHSKDKNAHFLIKEGEKVKKLAEQYVAAAKQIAKD